MLTEIYAVKTKRNRWQIRTTDQHFCMVSVSSQEHLEKSLRRLVRKYRNDYVLSERVRNQSRGGHVTYSEHKKWSLFYAKDLDTSLQQWMHKIVKEESKSIKGESPLAKRSKKTKIPKFKVKREPEPLVEDNTSRATLHKRNIKPRIRLVL